MQDERAVQQEQDAQPKATSARRLMMPAVVIGLLGGHVVFVMLAITFATGDRSFAVVPDYYQKAVSYDDRKQALADSAALGWKAEVQPGKTLDAIGEREVVVVLRDREGRPVSGAEVQLDGYHYARASEPVVLTMTEVLPGQYAGRGRVTRGGFWQLDVSAELGDRRFIDERKQYVSDAEAAR